jgi:alpha-tubulin suppressor-like RCC1 family protein
MNSHGCCRWLSADGSKQMGAAWGTPEEVLRLPQGVRSVSAGLHSSAAVSRDGQLWMWGKVISQVSFACCLLAEGLIVLNCKNFAFVRWLNATLGQHLFGCFFACPVNPLPVV